MSQVSRGCRSRGTVSAGPTRHAQRALCGSEVCLTFLRTAVSRNKLAPTGHRATQVPPPLSSRGRALPRSRVSRSHTSQPCGRWSVDGVHDHEGVHTRHTHSHAETQREMLVAISLMCEQCLNFINQNNHSLTILHLTIILSGYRCAASRLPPDILYVRPGARWPVPDARCGNALMAFCARSIVISGKNVP